MYHDRRNRLHYAKGGLVICPLTRKACLLTCPHVIIRDDYYSFVCGGSGVSTYKTNEAINREKTHEKRNS